MMDVLISILLPAYNVEKYIGQCFESIIGQDLSNCEIIVVDDGSTDGTGSICDKYSKKYSGLIKTIHKKNGGLLSARREGIRQAKGEYCMFVDSDDYLLPDALKILKGKIDKNGKPDIIIYNYSVDNGREELVLKDPQFFEETLFDSQNVRLLYEKIICSTELNTIWIKVIKKGLLDEDPMDYSRNINNSYGEDILQSLYPITYANRILYITDTLYAYRYNEAGMIRTYTVNSLLKKNCDDIVTNKMREYMSIWGMDDLNHKRIFETRHINIIMKYIRLTMANTHFKSMDCADLYKAIDEVVVTRKLDDLQGYYSDENIIKRIVFKLILERKYKILHILLRSIKGIVANV